MVSAHWLNSLCAVANLPKYVLRLCHAVRTQGSVQSYLARSLHIEHPLLMTITENINRYS
jgi:hypothetical protein